MNDDKKWNLEDFNGITIKKEYGKEQATIYIPEDSKLKIGDSYNLNTDDAEGFTPLCFAALNGVDSYTIKILRYCLADATKECNRGKTPLQFACMSMSKDVVDALTSNNIYVDKYDEDGFLVDYTDTSTGEYITVVNKAEYKLSNPAVVGNNEILSASMLPSDEMLEILLPHYKFLVDDKADLSFTDSSNNTPILLACQSQCYSSVDLLLEYDSNPSTSVSFNNNSGKNAYSVALDLGDKGLINKLSKHVDKEYIYAVTYIRITATSQFIKMSSVDEPNIALDGLFENRYIFMCLNDNFDLSTMDQTTLKSYCNSSSNRDSFILSMKDTFFNWCSTPSENILLFRAYLLFISKIVDIKFYILITAIYRELESSAALQDDPEWITSALSDDGKPNDWVDRSSIILSLKNSLKSNISSANYLEDDLYHQDPDSLRWYVLIPVRLWDIDYIIDHNYSDCLNYIENNYVEFGDLIALSHRLKIADKLADGTFSMSDVRNLLPTIEEAVENTKYSFINYMHNAQELSHDDWLLIKTAVEESRLDSAQLIGWPWPDPDVP